MAAPEENLDAEVLTLHITVGAQCSGKTTLIAKIPGCVDVCIDDFEGLTRSVRWQDLDGRFTRTPLCVLC